MLRLPKLCTPAHARYLLSCCNLGSNQGMKPVLSSSLAVRAGCLNHLEQNLSSVHTSCKQRIMGCTSISFVSWNSRKEGNAQTGQFTTIFPFSTSTKCMQENLANQLQEVKAKEYIPVYLHKRIKFVRYFCTLSKLSTILLLAGAPATLAAMLMNIISQDLALSLLFTMGFYPLVFTGQCYLILSRIICQIYVSEDQSYAKISHLSVFGKRRDVYVKVSDILPITGSLYDKKLHAVRLKESSKKFFLMLDAGGDDTDFEALELLFTSANVSKGEKPGS